jgi:hypothetical protein
MESIRRELGEDEGSVIDEYRRKIDEAGMPEAVREQADRELDRLERVGEGVYRTTEPIPVHGNWKSMIRLQRGNAIDAVPIFLPDDPAIPAAEVPATATFTRKLIPDSEVLQREQKTSVAGPLTAAAYSVVAGIALALLALLAWGLHRLAVTADRTRPGQTRGYSYDADARPSLPLHA